jgi:hypothetical protein
MSKPLPTDLEEFREDLQENMQYLEKHLANLGDDKDIIFADDLIKFYEKFDRLSDKQLLWAHKFWVQVRDVEDSKDSKEKRAG